MSFKEKINRDRLPQHIAIIMDGNGRWAKQHNRPRVFGHKNGAKSVKQIVEAAVEFQIQYMTLYAFSTENWNRPKAEIDALMTLLVSTINSEIDTLNKNNVRLLAIGDIESLPSNAKKKLLGAIEKTANNSGLTLSLALSYSARWEIVNAVRNIGKAIKDNSIDVDNINDELFSNYLTTSGMPDVELLIRTSGELRISNFLLWQIAYAELYFTPKMWPDFGKEDFYEAICDFQNRERRFGKTSEQLNK